MQTEPENIGPAREIDRFLNQQSISLELLVNAMKELSNRLTPVISESEQVEDGPLKAGMVTTTPVGKRIHLNTLTIEGCTELANNLINKLGV